VRRLWLVRVSLALVPVARWVGVHSDERHQIGRAGPSIDHGACGEVALNYAGERRDDGLQGSSELALQTRGGGNQARSLKQEALRRGLNEQVVVPLQWSRLRRRLVAKVRSKTGGVYVVTVS